MALCFLLPKPEMVPALARSPSLSLMGRNDMRTGRSFDMEGRDRDKDKNREDADLKLGLEQRLGVLKSGSLFSRPGDSETWPSGCSPSRRLAPRSGESRAPPWSCRLTQDCRAEAFLLDRGVSWGTGQEYGKDFPRKHNEI